MVPGRVARYGAATVRPIRSTFLPTALRVVIGLALVVGGTAAWFGVTPPFGESGGPVANAAPSASASGSMAGSPPPASPPPASPTAGSSTPPSQTGATPTPTPSPASQPTPPEPVEPSVPPSSTVDLRRQLSLALDGLRLTYGLPGVSAAILFADGSTWRGTSGVANVANERPVKADTEFAVASVSKTFLAALILVLAEEDKLGLETPVREYLPDLAIDKRITVRQLLDHTSGLRDYFYDPDIDEALLADRDAGLDRAGGARLRRRALLRAGRGLALLEHELRDPWAARRDGRRARHSPSSCTRAFWTRSGSSTPTTRAWTNHRRRSPAPTGSTGPSWTSQPIELTDGSHMVPFTSVVTAAGAAGSIASTAEDLVRWARALYDGEVLAPASLAAMVADVEADRALQADGPVRARRPGGRPSTGARPSAIPVGCLGSRSVVRWLPEERIAIAVLTNQSRNDPNLIAREPAQRRARPAAGLRRLPAAASRPLTLASGAIAVRPGTAPGAAGYDLLAGSVPTGSFRRRRERLRLRVSPGEGQHGDPCRCLHDRGDGQRRARLGPGRCARRSSLRRIDSSSTEPPGRASTIRRRESAGSRDRSPCDDILVAVADDDPTLPVHAVWHHVHLDAGPYVVEGELATMPGFDPGRALTRPSGEFVLLRDVRLSRPGRPDVRRRRSGDHALVNRYAVERIRADLMLGFFFPGAETGAPDRPGGLETGPLEAGGFEIVQRSAGLA